MRAASDRRSLVARSAKTRDPICSPARAGKYDEARPIIERALVTAEKLLGSESVRGPVSYGAGNLIWPVRRPKRWTMYERALAIFAKELGLSTLGLLTFANRFGSGPQSFR